MQGRGLQAEISVFSDVWAKTPDGAMSVREFIMENIAASLEEPHAQAVNRIREALENLATPDQVGALKKELPAASISGMVTQGLRANAMAQGRFVHSGFLQIDLDAKDMHPRDPEAVRDQLRDDPHVQAAWLSPTGGGVKGLLYVGACRTPKDHETAFFAAEAYFRETYALTLDKSCKDPVRLCFVSYDPGGWTREVLADPLPVPRAAAPHRELKPTAPTIKPARSKEFPPPPVQGIHAWLMEAAWHCRFTGMTEADTVAKLQAFDGSLRRRLQPTEAVDAARKVFSAARDEMKAYPAADVAVPAGVAPVPGGPITYTRAGEIIFAAMGEQRRLYMRGETPHEVATGDTGDVLRQVSDERFCSLVERIGLRVAKREIKKTGSGDSVVWRSATFPKNAAKILLASDTATAHLPPIRQVTGCPIITPDGEILSRGYHAHNGGTYVSAGAVIEDMRPGTAFQALRGLLVDFDFASPADCSRAFASFISPALKMGGWIEDDFPLDLAEADQSQSGKTFRQKLVALIYGEEPATITLQSGGVGSLDEKISEALVRGRPFITLGNVRGRVDSQILEEALRGSGRVACRYMRVSVPAVDCKPFLWQLSTNGAELTRDLANRAIVTRIRKRPEGHEWKTWPEGSLEAHLRRNRALYLSAVFAILREWKRQGCPTTSESRHEFRGWCRALDGIVQMLQLPPLLDDHREHQLRTANPALQWLRSVLLAIPEADINAAFYASDLASIAEDAEIQFPGKANDQSGAAVRVGRILRKLFRDAESDTIEVDSFKIQRIKDTDASGREVKLYTIEKP